MKQTHTFTFRENKENIFFVFLSRRLQHDVYFLCDLFHSIGFLFCILWKSMTVPLLFLQTWIFTDPCSIFFYCKAESISPNQPAHKSIVGELNLQRALRNTLYTFTQRSIQTVERRGQLQHYSAQFFIGCDILHERKSTFPFPTIASHHCIRNLFFCLIYDFPQYNIQGGISE